MQVKELRALLEPEDGELEVIVRCAWLGEAPASPEFEIAGVVRELHPDTALEFVALECDQDDVMGGGGWR